MARYHAYYKGKTADIEAPGLYPAKLAAIAHFGPLRKSQEYLVSVVLFERDDGTPVSLFNSNADFG
jgi:hypothetical protein